MRPLAALLVLSFSLALVGPAAVAQVATPVASPAAGPRVLPPDEPAYGATYAEWLARQTQWMLSFPASVNPATDPTGERCGYGQSGPVFFLAPVFGASPQATRACTVPAGVALLLPLFGTECSTDEPPPFFGRDEAELRACAAAEIEAFAPEATMGVSLNGATVPARGRYRVQTPPTVVALPPDDP